MHQVLPALGQTAKLGQLYDANSGEFSSQQIFTVADIATTCAKAVNTTEIGNVSFYNKIISNTLDKFDLLNIEASLKLKLLTIGTFEGSGKYLKENKNSYRSNMLTVTAAVTTIDESFNIGDNSLREYFNTNCNVSALDATHYVSKIVWGGRAFLSVTDSSSEDYNKADTKGRLEGLATYIEGVGAAEKYSGSAFSSKLYEYSIRSDSVEDTSPSCFEDAMNLWGSIPGRLRSQNGGKGIPLSFHLSPISEFYKQQTQIDASSSALSVKMEKKLEISTLMSVEAFLSSLESIEQRITDIRTDSDRLEKNISKSMRNGLKDIIANTFSRIPSFRSEILDILREVRLESETVVALVERIGDFVEQLNVPLNQLQKLEVEITKKLKLIQYLKSKGYTVFGEGDRFVLNDAKLSSKDSHLVFLTFRFSPTDEFNDSQENNIALVETARTADDPVIFTTPKLYAVDLDVLTFMFCDTPLKPVQVHVSYGGVFTTHDMLADWESESAFSVVRVITTMDNSDAPEYDQNAEDHIESLKRSLNDNTFVRYTGRYPGNIYDFLVSCPNQRCKQKTGCQKWCCQECKNPIKLVVRSDVYPVFPDTLMCSQCRIIALPEKVEFRCCSVSTHGRKYLPYEDRRSLMQQIQEMKGNCFNVVILGETGVGKSTFINAFANYLQSQSLQDMMDQPNKVKSLIATEFTMPDPSNGKLKTCTFGKKSAEEERAVTTTGASFTQTCTTYIFSVDSVTIRIVDTPGLVDARGTEQDLININDIMSYLQHFKEVHAFLFLFKAGTNRLQIPFQYCFKAFLNKLHKDAIKNIIFVTTHSKKCNVPSESASILDEMLHQIRTENKIELYRNYCKIDSPDTNDFYVDSDAFRLLVAHQNGIKFEVEKVKELSTYWTDSSITCEQIFEHVRILPPHDVSSTRSVHTVQIMYQDLVQPMAEIQKTITANLARAEDENKKLKTEQLTIKDLEEKVFVKQRTLNIERLRHPRTVCKHAECSKIVSVSTEDGKCYTFENATCSDGRKFSPIWSFFYFSTIFPSLQNCQCGHSYEYHQYTNMVFQQVEKTVEDESYKIKLQDLKIAQEEMIKINEDKIKALEASKAKIENFFVMILCYLKQNSMVPINDRLIMYLDTQITLYEKDAKDADRMKEWRNRHLEFVAKFKTQGVEGKTTIEEIDHHMKELVDLAKVYGLELKETYDEKVTAKEPLEVHCSAGSKFWGLGKRILGDIKSKVFGATEKK